MKGYLLGIDIGTSACKVAVFDESGYVKGSANCSYPVYYPHPGWVEQNPCDWWNAVCNGVKQVISKSRISPSDIAAIGVDGQSWSCIPVDRQGNCLANTPIWMDTRARNICDDVKSKLGFNRIFEVSGNDFLPSYTTPKILWFKENYPELYKNVYKFMQSNSYIVMKFTGNISTDLSQGYGTHFFKMSTCRYDEDLARDLGISIDKVPELYRSHEIVGLVTKEAAEASGLIEGIPVVAGGLDAACGTLGGGVYRPGQAQEQGGQAGGMSICVDSALAHPKLILSPHVVPQMWLLQGGTVGGGGTLRWFREQFGEGKSFDELTRMAEAISVGSDGVVFLPYMAGERSPIWNPDAKGVYYGLGFDKTKAHMLRATLEGVAYSLEHNLMTASESGVDAKELISIGGASNSILWTQIKADVTGKVIKVPNSDTATTLGAAILGGVGVGLYNDFETAIKKTIVITREQRPDPESHRKYRQYMELYLDLSDKMQSIFGKH